MTRVNDSLITRYGRRGGDPADSHTSTRSANDDITGDAFESHACTPIRRPLQQLMKHALLEKDDVGIGHDDGKPGGRLLEFQVSYRMFTVMSSSRLHRR